MEFVILVDEQDREIGEAEKMQTHKLGLLHRAFSVLIYNTKGEMLLQQRAETKYHSGGLWSNACCGHPRPGEKIEDAARRRLKEELGFNCSLKFSFKFIYKASFENSLKEHELDHVFTGIYDSEVLPDKNEVQAYRWVTMENLKNEIIENHSSFSVWFQKIIAVL
ncbi:MAG: isopentenyl-diphosphate Delta-isomerase [Bacteroidetes bacterium]|nr:isopentenyl-diphosphate Delta-isomerase [Bacteroidota bacterium]MBX7239452.1 isopentenyl-diphosphate Delta-isomerase [Bacteroidia bacterium]MCC7515382.1 isopentenyl-diphosphate Delta-isomerase [Bacteroidia bacterium]MCW5919696.1 isopentenyl-diphosphate Delta-isomerase [Bacteroidota bacterium]HMU76966.1 isopentenyl-diphosphate Delta-isomerase [Bacteroidia bacterium]